MKELGITWIVMGVAGLVALQSPNIYTFLLLVIVNTMSIAWQIQSYKNN